MADERREAIAELLQRRLDELRARDGAVGPGPAGSPAARPGSRGPWAARAQVPDPALDAAGLHARLIFEYEGRTLADALGAHPLGRDDLFEAAGTVDLPMPAGSRDRLLAEVGASLWLLPGVREGVAARLVAAGRREIGSLLDHPRHGPDARRLLRLIERGDAAGLMNHLGFRASRAHPLALRLSALFDPSDFLFLDLETMGLFGGSPIILAGLAHATAGGVEIRQVIAADPAAEAALVREVAAAIEAHPALVTFNGRSFDLPYVCARSAFYGRPIAADPVHFDLLHFARRVYAGRVPDCRLDTLARHVLGMDRGEDVPGSLVPSFYHDYLEDPERRVGLLAAIAVHNRADMEQMVRLFAALHDEAGR